MEIVFGKALKISLEVRQSYRSRFLTRIQNLDRKHFKGLSPSTTPFGKRKFCRIVESTIHQIYLLSIPKMGL